MLYAYSMKDGWKTVYDNKVKPNSSGGPLSALTCCDNVRLLSGDKENAAR